MFTKKRLILLKYLLNLQKFHAVTISTFIDSVNVRDFFTVCTYHKKF